MLDIDAGVTVNLLKSPIMSSSQIINTGLGILNFNNSESIFINVKDFGAIGDGVTDDTQAFKNAVATGLPVYIPFSDGMYLITDEIDFAGKPMNITGDGTVRYFENVTVAPVIKFAPVGNDKALFKNMHKEGYRLNNLHLVGPDCVQSAAPNYTITPTAGQTRIDAIRTSTTNGQKFFNFENLVISNFSGAGIRFMAHVYNWAGLRNIKFGFCKWGVRFETTSDSNHLYKYQNIHFANCEVGVMGVSEDYNMDTSGNLRFMNFDSCVFEFCRYGLVSGSGFTGKTPIHFTNCWFEEIGNNAYLVQDTDVLETACQFTSAAAGSVTYGGSRPTANRYNQADQKIGVANIEVLRAKLADQNLIFKNADLDWITNGDLGNLGTIKCNEAVESFVLPASGSYTVLEGISRGAFFAVYGLATGTRHAVYCGTTITAGTPVLFGQNYRTAANPWTFAMSGSSLVITNTLAYDYNCSIRIIKLFD